MLPAAKHSDRGNDLVIVRLDEAPRQRGDLRQGFIEFHFILWVEG